MYTYRHLAIQLMSLDTQGITNIEKIQESLFITKTYTIKYDTSSIHLVKNRETKQILNRPTP